jgi:transposase
MGDDQRGLPHVPPRPAPSEPGAGPARERPGEAVPRVKAVDRTQMLLRPVVVEQLIPEDHPARAIWAFVGQLDLTRYAERIRSVEGSAGRPAWDPQLLVSVWVYSYSRGVSSARAIERLCEYEPAYQWLTGLESISGHTLSDFRVAHADVLRDLFVQVLALLSAEGLITLERVMQDGTRIRACAASKRFRRKPRIEAYLAQAREAVAALDALTEEASSLQIQRAQARAKREQLERLEAALQEFEKLTAAQSTADRVSTTDPEARVMKQADGGYAPNYNVQISTDAAHGLIIGIAVTQAGSDYQQLTPAVDRLEQTLPRAPDQMVVDGGYISNDNIVAMAHRGIDLVGPAPQDHATETNRRKSYQHRGVSPDYEAPLFLYEAATNTYACRRGSDCGTTPNPNARARSATATRPRKKTAAPARPKRSAVPARDAVARSSGGNRCPRSARSGRRCRPTTSARSIGPGRRWPSFRICGSRPSLASGSFACAGSPTWARNRCGPPSPTTSNNGFASVGDRSVSQHARWREIERTDDHVTPD